MAYDFDGQCKRIDLYLRAEFPYLKTIIYRVSQHEYQIYIGNIDNFDYISEHFDHKIRFMAVHIYLVKEKPSKFNEIIKPIIDNEISKNFEGLPFTNPNLCKHIESKYPDVDLVNIKENHNEQVLLVEIEKTISNERLKFVEDDLNKIRISYKFVLSYAKDTAKKVKKELSENKFDNSVLNIYPSKTYKSLNAPYIERDEKLWFENVDNAFNNSFKKEDLAFINDKTKCLVNLSIFENVNLRNLLLMYDIIYCILPLQVDMNNMLQSQKLNHNDLLYMVEKGRIIFVNLQPESRLDIGFLNEAFQQNSNSVIGRRALSLLTVIDLVEINNNYIFNDDIFQNDMVSFLRVLENNMNLSKEQIAKFLYWPKYALRKSFDGLHNNGILSMSSFGVNSLVEDVICNSSNKKDVFGFEFAMSSPQIHLAHSLDATYFPFFDRKTNYSDSPYSLIMSNFLNFFKHANIKTLNELNELNTNRLRGNPSIDLINTFEVNNYIDIQDFLPETDNAVIRNGMKSLFSELCLLDEEERKKEISMYNKEVELLLAKQRMKKEELDLGVEIVSAATDAIFVKQILKVISFGKNKIDNKFPKFKEKIDELENKIYTSQFTQKERNISYLSKINRVARLRKN
ncbi:hypothetical protein [Aliarcobacter butzleri]|uniref:hypothetical protein n=1 Tax=Aliarcobacter butzleri TaxID=28197 RepID=UPI0021B42A16|nr:hypothetical protein [Aliarcobacter butzleri]MCT7590452.1 hypothetical protein [Aliarcobacter butzleri]